MAECSEISLLIGPFEDGELEPHEMQEVARHLARCSSCDEILGDYSSLGRELRGAAPTPNLDGFAQGVLARIATLPKAPPPRAAGWFSEFLTGLSGTIAMGALAGAVAVATAIVVTPYVQQRITHQATPVASLEAKTVAKMASPVAAADAATPVAQTEGAPVMESMASSGDEPPMMSESPGDSHAIISRLESEIPSVAVWSEPHNDTTVIWLPSEQQ